MSTASDEDLIQAVLKKVEHLSTRKAAEEIGGGVTHDAVWRWRKKNQAELNSDTRVAVMAYLGLRAGADEGATEAYRRGLMKALELITAELEGLPPTPASSDLEDQIRVARSVRTDQSGGGRRSGAVETPLDENSGGG